ncbi:MAG: molybdopterin synthase sulfur carrier subunit [SAR202 cluster bacterium Io17-Chloro-G4]|nr:MAG: molybdopterin synthase sulfur carrier subunit [SAR202 cluster bacterium Io17-Chloro-G4]
MSVMIRIPTPLRRMTNGESKVEIDTQNVGDMVEKLDSSFPGFKARLVDENGDLRYFVNIYLNGEDVRFLQGLDTTTKSGDEVSIVPAVAGGAWI